MCIRDRVDTPCPGIEVAGYSVVMVRVVAASAPWLAKAMTMPAHRRMEGLPSMRDSWS